MAVDDDGDGRNGQDDDNDDGQDGQDDDDDDNFDDLKKRNPIQLRSSQMDKKSGGRVMKSTICS